MVQSRDQPSETEHGNSGHVDVQALEQTINRLSASTTDGVTLEDALELVVHSSHELFRLAGTGVMIFDDLDVLRYVAASDKRARVLEDVQENVGQGPCVDAAVYGMIVESEDVASDERWPELARGMKGQGVGGVLGVPIRLSGQTVGSLNVYAESRCPWDDSDRAAIRAFEEFVEQLLQTAISAHKQGAIIEQLEYALDHRVLIERAVGMVMGREHLEAPAAFERLRSAARRQRVLTAEIAERHLAGESTRVAAPPDQLGQREGMSVNDNSDWFLSQEGHDRLLMLPGTAIPVVEALNDGIVVAGPDNRILYANRAVERLLGWRPEDLMGAPITVLVPERLRAAHLAGFARYLASGQARIIGLPTRVPALSPDGSERAVELVLSTLPLSDGGELAVATVRDVVVRVDFEQRSALAHHLLSIFTEEAAEAELVDHILAALGESLSAAVAALWLPSPDGRQLYAAAVWNDAAQPRPTFERATRELRLGRGECLPGRVWRSGEAAWIGELGSDTKFRRRPAAIADILHSAFAFPVQAHAMTLGVIELLFPEPRDPDDTSLEVMAIIGSRLGEFLQHKHLEMERQRIAELEREIATSLQESLLPAELPAIPGLELGVYFRPGGDLVIGGDFYDVFPIRTTKNAEPTAWGLLVGDVCGTGPAAAAITGLVRYTVRALARMGLAPVEVLTQVNAALLDRGAPEDRFCTGVFAVVIPQGDGCVLRLTNAGHPAPLLRRHGSSAAPVEVNGQLLGVFETISLSEEVIELGADDTIIFYTDGVTEARADGELFGEERLLTVLNDADGASAAEIAGRVVRTAQEFADSISDDIVVLVMQAIAPSENAG